MNMTAPLRKLPRIPKPAKLAFRSTAVAIVLIGAAPGATFPVSLPPAVAECVPCHDGGAMDQVGEWLASPYSAAEGGLGCADCHATRCSGAEGDEFVDRSIRAENLGNLRRAIRLSVTATRSGDSIEAEVAVTNVGAGHYLPTLGAGRSLLLEVVAGDRDGATLRPPIDPRSTSSPPRAIRLAPFETLVRQYRFVAPEDGPVPVTARCLLVSAEGGALEIANTATLCRGTGPKP
jgi:hypothetical protein